jgi:hypothetical protein
MKYPEPVLPHLFQLYNEEDMGVQEYLGDENQGKQKQANSCHRTLWQVSPTHPPSQKFAYRAALEPKQNKIVLCIIFLNGANLDLLELLFQEKIQK